MDALSIVTIVYIIFTLPYSTIGFVVGAALPPMVIIMVTTQTRRPTSKSVRNGPPFAATTQKNVLPEWCRIFVDAAFSTYEKQDLCVERELKAT
jgi:hypothetical protein